jgi:hypothetical protein
MTGSSSITGTFAATLLSDLLQEFLEEADPKTVISAWIEQPGQRI